jgi:hypothetical protein
MQRLQAFRWEWPTIPASTTSSATRRAWRAQAASTSGKGWGWSIPACRRRGQRHLRRTRVAGEQKAAKAQRPTGTGGNHQCSGSLPVVRVPNHLQPSRSMAQLRPSGQVPTPHRSSDPREQGKESTSGRGEQHQRYLPSDALGLGGRTQRPLRARHPFLQHCADRRGVPARSYLHSRYLLNSRKLQNRVPEV